MEKDDARVKALAEETAKLRAEVVEFKRKYHQLKDGFDENLKHLVQRTQERDKLRIEVEKLKGEKVALLRRLMDPNTEFLITTAGRTRKRSRDVEKSPDEVCSKCHTTLSLENNYHKCGEQ